MITPVLTTLAADELHDIAPPVDYSLIPSWAIVAGIVAAIVLVGLAGVWLIRRFGRGLPPPPLPRERALDALQKAQAELDRLPPYQFSIRVSDILRRYVSEQFGLPVTRQTSFEFLEQLKGGSTFSDEEKELLEAFLNRCDLIKFARYEAGIDDSRLLLEEAVHFVEGGQPAYATA